MNKISLYFKDIDKKIFEQLGLLSKLPLYEDFLDRIENLSDGRGKIITMALGGFIIVLPLFVALMFFWGNASLKQSLQVKKNIAQTIYDYKTKEVVSKPLKSARLAGALVKSKDNFLRSINLSPEQKRGVVVEKLKYKKVSKELGRSVISLSFNNFTTRTLVDMIKKITSQHKASVSRIHIEKDKTLKTLMGKIELIVHGTVKDKKKDKDK